MNFPENIDLDIDKGVLQTIDIDNILFEPFFFEHGPKNWNAMLRVIFEIWDKTQGVLGSSGLV